MMSTALLLLSALACGALTLFGMREHRRMMAGRERLLDEAAGLFEDADLTVGPDHLPSVSGALADGSRVRLDVMTDTLVTRRLPQLWLRVTLTDAAKTADRSAAPVIRPAIGILSRPTGAEFYSLVHDLPEWLPPPPSTTPLLMRGDEQAAEPRWARLREGLATLIADASVKEAVVTPRMVRVMIQAAEGDRGAHLMLRQVRFPIQTIPAQSLQAALDLALALRTLASQPDDSTLPHGGDMTDSKARTGQPSTSKLEPIATIAHTTAAQRDTGSLAGAETATETGTEAAA